jgi:hypothetical protein
VGYDTRAGGVMVQIVPHGADHGPFFRWQNRCTMARGYRYTPRLPCITDTIPTLPAPPVRQPPTTPPQHIEPELHRRCSIGCPRQDKRRELESGGSGGKNCFAMGVGQRSSVRRRKVGNATFPPIQTGRHHRRNKNPATSWNGGRTRHKRRKKRHGAVDRNLFR